MGVGKRSRSMLAAEYRDRYEREILDHADLAGIFGPLERTRAVLMCVESDPAACHRSLIAAGLQRMGWRVDHILPEASSLRA